MSGRKLSASASLLRNSRLFALPPPLPRPYRRTEYARQGFDSDTATTSYPTHAAIETPIRSHARGDWGLKRSLPVRKTQKSSTPAIRIDNVDSIDFVTDYHSAGEHTRTLVKWQELDMPLSAMNMERGSDLANRPPKSVFETDVDNTAKDDESENTRWGFEGPWLAGLAEGEFQYYMKNTVKQRRSEFQDFIRQHIVNKKNVEQRMEKQASGELSEDTGLESCKASDISDQELATFTKQIFANEDLMRQLVNEFLDLPREKGFTVSTPERASLSDRGPPSTHPSGGLSYLRTASHMYNHPLHGPQDDKTPIEARILAPQMELGQSSRRALLGVAGVVTEDINTPFASKTDESQVERFLPDVQGGGKIYVEPFRANLDRHGGIQISVKRAEKNAVEVLKTDRGELTVDAPADIPTTPPSSFMSAPLEPPQDASEKRSEPQGYGLEDMATPRGGKPSPLGSRGPNDLTSLLEGAYRR